jgi:transcriptional regulator with XRE-family HTH domain
VSRRPVGADRTFVFSTSPTAGSFSSCEDYSNASGGSGDGQLSSRTARPRDIERETRDDGHGVDAARAVEGELLFSEFAETVSALLLSSGLKQKELAARMGLGEPRVSRLLRGDANTTLRAIAGVGWALGYRFELVPIPLEDREGTPAHADPPPPAWVPRLRWHLSRSEGAERPRAIRPRAPD